ncbi:MAG: radical SAM protein [Planctomycetes bacterium]|nr:radical SAM protein [Planctomycetota bacterium]
MQIQTLSLVVGTAACDADCPFCVSKMTGFGELPDSPLLNQAHLRKAIALAKMGGCTTALITGKGEPTLYPSHIHDLLEADLASAFPFIELQTNGMILYKALYGKHPKLTKLHLLRWLEGGLNTIAISSAGYIDSELHTAKHEALVELNAKHYGRGKGYLPMTMLVDGLHHLGFTVRLCVMAQKGGIDTIQDVALQVTSAKRLGVDQLTIRPLTAPGTSNSVEASKYVQEHAPECFNNHAPQIPGQSVDDTSVISKWASLRGTLLRRLQGGGEVYDIGGQNLGVYNCLTVDKDADLRSLIFYANGRLTYSWQHPGAVLLAGYE